VKRRSAVAVVAAFAPPARGPAADSAVDALRKNLGSGIAREHVVLDFLEDDLRDARAALGGVAAWLGGVERALSEASPSQQRILALAAARSASERLDDLSAAVASVRRRLAQVGARM
jgi:hypothetical protein